MLSKMEPLKRMGSTGTKGHEKDQIARKDSHLLESFSHATLSNQRHMTSQRLQVQLSDVRVLYQHLPASDIVKALQQLNDRAFTTSCSTRTNYQRNTVSKSS